MVLHIRNAEMTDLQVLQGIFRRASLSNVNDRELLREHPEWLVLSDQAVRERRTRVAEDGQKVVTGFATYVLSEGVAELEDLFVDPSRMREGIATALVRDVSVQLIQLGFEILEVTANPHAMPFYEHVGFTAVRTINTPGYRTVRMCRPNRSRD